tara:strand:+ start:198 stop:413 length:216 start_codon:yes stop_codon:yes gene_type:complete
LNTAEFKGLGRKQYISLKIALYRNTCQSTRAKQEYHQANKEYKIKEVSDFVILDIDSNLVARPDLYKSRSG